MKARTQITAASGFLLFQWSCPGWSTSHQLFLVDYGLG